MDDDVIARADLTGKDIEFADAPPGADPDAKGSTSPQPGYHIVHVVDYALKPNEEFKHKGEVFIAHQLRPTLETESGERVTDFLPMPGKGQVVSVMLANRWLQFLKAFGFKAPEGSMAPAGFHPDKLIGARAVVKIVWQKDRDGNVKTYMDEPQSGVKFFGYHTLDEWESLKNRTVEPDKTAQPAASQAVAGTDIKL